MLLIAFFCPFVLAVEPLRLAIYLPSFPPYMFFTPERAEPQGIVVDLLTLFSAEESLQLEFVADNRKGGEQRLYNGEVSAMILSPDWVSHPDRLIFSQPILPYNDYLFRLQRPDNTEIMQGSTICTREYYVYPNLTDLFDSQYLLRVDATGEASLLKMLENGRCDYAYIHDQTAYWLIGREFPQLKLQKLSSYMAEDAIRLAFHPRWQPVLQRLDSFIDRLREGGELETLRKNYVQE
ncbi:transporter substrate-binding domain-containing protein [Bowmanella dokdonensis]|uniref:Transporter substrate-binding domain-containing protein n=1 Tax=Bowmanella dokdonensis TaxID=751969 RepID=A0A939DK79_9ALTE|nr:transporter substrate-binding domain-containing protein [Bowmanella dokdonensis]